MFHPQESDVEDLSYKEQGINESSHVEQAQEELCQKVNTRAELVDSWLDQTRFLRLNLGTDESL